MLGVRPYAGHKEACMVRRRCVAPWSLAPRNPKGQACGRRGGVEQGGYVRCAVARSCVFMVGPIRCTSWGATDA
eukprot:5187510-Prymnesium_polylepis.2